MSLNIAQGLVAALILQNKKRPQTEVVAAAGVSALLPGALGLVVPLALVAKSNSSTSSSQGGGETTGQAVTLVKVPDVIGKTFGAAVDALKLVGITAVEEDVTILGVIPGPNQLPIVVDREPSDLMLPTPSTVTLRMTVPANPQVANQAAADAAAVAVPATAPAGTQP